jgi:hypothetical protein
MNGDPASRWRAIVACLEHRDGASDEPVEMLEQLQAQLREELYDAAGVPLQRASSSAAGASRVGSSDGSTLS